MTFRFIAILAASAASLAAVAPANANVPADVVPQVHVGYGDLDLTSAAGRKALAHRVHGAVGQVCDTDDVGQRLQAAACRTEATERAKADLRNAGVSVL